MNDKLEKRSNAQLDAQPTTAADVRLLMAKELVKRTPDRYRLQGLTRLLDSFEVHEEAVSEALTTITTERDALLVEVTALREQAVKNGPLQEQINKMIAEQAEWKATQHQLLVAENQAYCWKAQRAEREAHDTLASAKQQFSKTGLEALLDEMKRLVEVHGIPQPDIWNLPENVNPLLLTLWGWSSIKASLFVGYTRSYPKPSEDFKNTLQRCLTARLPIYSSGMVTPLEQLGIEPDPTAVRNDGPKPIEHLSVKIEVLMMMAQRWPGVLNEVQRRVDEEQVRRQAEAVRNNNDRLDAQQRDLARMGYDGSDKLITPVIDEHWEGCGCDKCEDRRKGRSRNVEHVEEVF